MLGGTRDQRLQQGARIDDARGDVGRGARTGPGGELRRICTITRSGGKPGEDGKNKEGKGPEMHAER